MPPDVERLVGDRVCGPIVMRCWNLPSFVSRTVTVSRGGTAFCRRRGHRQVARRPRGEHVRRVARVLAPGQQVIGGVERDEALRMLRREEDRRGVIDRHDGVGRRVHDEQRAMQARHGLRDLLHRDVFQEFAPNREAAARKVDFGGAAAANLVFASGEEIAEMRGSDGALIVATARADGICAAAARMAAPPRLCPTSSDGAACSRSRKRARRRGRRRWS